MPYLKLSFFATAQVTVADQPIRRFRSLRELALLAYLAVEAERVHRRETLAGLLWPDHAEESARRNLNQTLFNLRNAIHDRDVQPSFLLLDRHSVQFNHASDYWLDVSAFTAALIATQAHAHTDPNQCETCMQRLAQAVALYQGPFLQDFSLNDSDLYEEWLLLKREWLHRQAATMLGRLSAYYLRENDYAQALQYAQRQAALDALNEEAHRHVLQSLALGGRRSDALTQFEVYRDQLAAELGVEPSAETLALVVQIRTGELDKGARKQAGNAPLPVPILVGEEHQAADVRVSHQDWRGAAEPPLFVGREAEVAQLTGWLREGVRFIAVLGMGGIGKTTLALRVARAQAKHFDVVIWRSLLNAPPLTALLSDWLQVLSHHHLTSVPPTLDGQLALLFEKLHQQRCLLVLDNWESILQSEKAGRYRSNYEAYGQLLQRLGAEPHRSCLLLTSRERPQGVGRMEAETPAVRTLDLAGLDREAGQQILQAQGLDASVEEAATLVYHYSGNPLALKLVARTLHEFLDDDIAAFQAETPLFDDVRDVLDEQFSRLTRLEQALLLWLAVERVPATVQTLRRSLVPAVSGGAFLEALRSLQRRSLLESSEIGFSVQNVVLEYLTDSLIEQVCQEVVVEKVSLLNTHALLKARAPEYVRQSQVRTILDPIGRRLLADLGCVELASKCQRLLNGLREEAPGVPGYAAGNLLNLLLHLGYNLHGYDFSRLSVWQAYLQGMQLPDVDFSAADLAHSVFTQLLGDVQAIQFTANSQLLVAGIADSMLCVWRAADGQLLQTYQQRGVRIAGAIFSPDGRTLAGDDLDHTVHLWDVESGRLRHTLPGHTNVIWGLAFSQDGMRLASGSTDCIVRVWDVESGRLLLLLHGHTNAVTALAFSPDRQILASAGVDGTVRLWHLDRGDLLCTFQGHQAEVHTLVFDPTGQILASGSHDGTIRLWEVGNKQMLRVLCRHAHPVRCLAMSADGHMLASGGADPFVCLWDVRTGQCLRTLLNPLYPTFLLAFHPDGQTLVSGSQDSTIHLWDMRTGQRLSSLRVHSNPIYSVDFSPDGQRLVSGSGDGIIRLWEVGSGRVVRAFPIRTHENVKIALSPNGKTVACGSIDHTVRVWDVGGGETLHTLRGHRDRVECVRFSPDGQILASGSTDRTVRLWDANLGQALRVLTGPRDRILACAFSPDGRIVASGGMDCTIYLWMAESGELLYILHGHTNAVNGVAFSSDGRILVTSSYDSTVRLWDTQTGQALDPMLDQPTVALTVACHPHNETLATGSVDQIVRLWHLPTGRLLHSLDGHTAAVEAVTFSPDGRTLASSSRDETIRVWEVTTGTCLQTLRAEGPYAGMKITGVTGITEAQKAVLKALGAVEGYGHVAALSGAHQRTTDGSH